MSKSLLLDVQAIDVCYGEFKALDGVHLQLEEGRCAAVVGAPDRPDSR